MNQKIKLIWDFRGQNAFEIAKHHEIHLKEFLEKENFAEKTTGFEMISEMFSIAFMIVKSENMIMVRDALRPHRAEVFEG
jgi:L-arabinose isomerase